MPRITKKAKSDDFINAENEETKKVETKKTTKVSSKSATSTKETKEKDTTKSATTKKKATTKKASEKDTEKKASKKVVEKESKSKVKSDDKKEEKKATKTTKKVSDAKAKKTTTKKTKVNPIKSILSKARRTKKADSTKPATVLEYYDLPYRYNQTTVKILAQTPSILFVYWDISDEDRANFVEKYGDNFFYSTKPVLLIHNKTKDYSFEVEINDFANSWYLRMQEPDCEYEIELGRRSIEDTSKYIYVSSSNRLVSPNDHVLFEESDFRHIKFRNVKTGQITEKDFGSLYLMTNIGKIYNKEHKVYRFYNDLYKDEVLDSNKMFSNPSSGNPTSGMF